MVIIDKVVGDSFIVVGLEEFSWGMLELMGWVFIVFFCVEFIFEGGVVVVEFGLEFDFVVDGVEFERFVGGEDDGLF